MIKKFTIFFVAAFSLTCFASENVAPKEEVKVESDLKTISQSFGHLIVKNLETIGFEFDMPSVVQGLQDAIAGKEAPLDENACVQAISAIQEKGFNKLAETNLVEAETFLETNAKAKSVVSLEDGKIQYRVEKTGTGEIVKEHDSPMIRYTGKFMSGEVFGQSKEEELISLDETIPGFSKGIVGMKEGETRTLFIHPEYGYGVSGYLPPNALLSFEIEVVKANAPKETDENLANIEEVATGDLEQLQATR
ncbi:MAG: Outer membrane protein MIP [Chlamydiia bacterium]|nr:Outer membrane protein MIP [Chlamydiia bacterium]MCH9616515.1 Outer membrane protein MIP [Chlamydiia bacterium]MCH9629499.1 Outer membrane protein MIP [Chlamydiia bacterium]